MDIEQYEAWALEALSQGYIPIMDDIGDQTEIIAIKSIHEATKLGVSKLELRINSCGGYMDSCVNMVTAMRRSGIVFTGLVTCVAQSAAFNLLQYCDIRLATTHARMMFHLGRCGLGNADQVAILLGKSWPIEHIRQHHAPIIKLIQARSSLDRKTILRWALEERDISAQLALKVGLIDAIVDLTPKPTKRKGKKKN